MEESLVLGFIGRMGAGKTLNMVIWANIISELTGWPIYSNISIVGAKKYANIRELENKQNIIVAHDEIHIDFDSRDWKDNKKRQEFTHWFTQTRKMQIIFLYTTQNIDALEKRVRRQNSFMMWCTKTIVPGPTDNEFAFSINVDLLDTQLGLEHAVWKRTVKMEHPEIFYDLYNTREVVTQGFYG